MIHGAQVDGVRIKIAGVYMTKALAPQRILLEKTARGKLEGQIHTALMFLAGVFLEKMNLIARIILPV